MNKYDPDEIFINNFGRRLKRTGTKMDIDPKTIHCAILDNCICSKNSDCGTNQICSTVSGYVYKVCRTRNEVAPVVTDIKSLVPPPLGIVPWLVSTLPTLVKSVISNCSLTDAVGTVGLLLPSLIPMITDKPLQTAGTLVEQLGKLKSLGDLVGEVGTTLVGILNG